MANCTVFAEYLKSKLYVFKKVYRYLNTPKYYTNRSRCTVFQFVSTTFTFMLW